ncbi:hypothetical protein F2S75_30430, partial [Pseudomonas syringae pv. actinidiae]|nr:hypothetical protein [Pseudomonas syringae pv. actinidiae]
THLSSLPQAWQTPPASAPTVFNETVTSARGTLLLNDSIHLYPAQLLKTLVAKYRSSGRFLPMSFLKKSAAS